MGVMTINGTKDLEAMLSALQDQSEDIAKRSLYKGAEVIADQIKENIRSIPISEVYGTEEIKKRGISADEYIDLRDSMGVAGMRSSGGAVDTSIGFHGYNSKGKPNAVIARSVERGTSFMYPTHFIKTAVNGQRSAAKKAMIKEAEETIDKITK